MKSDTPVIKDLVLVGGGHSHVEVLRRFGMRPLPGVRLTLISRGTYSPYSGMLPGLVAGHYEFDDTHIDLEPLTRFAGARFYRDEAVGLDLEGKRVLCGERPPVPYDILSINAGAAPNTADVPGAARHTTPVKPIARFYARWGSVKERLARAGGGRIGVVGGGAGGVEITLAIRHRLRQLRMQRDRAPDALEFHLLTDGDEILETHNRWVRRKFRRVLDERGVRVHTGHRVVRVELHRVHCTNDAVLEFDEILWVISAGAPRWPAEAGLAVDADGFVRVHETLRSVSHTDIFAAGDVATVEGHPRPKAGVFAVRQGPPLDENLRRALQGRALKRFSPQRRFLSLISTGDRHAIASWGPWALEGDWVWRWKDWIDRRWMRRYKELPEMAVDRPEVPEGLADREALEAISSFAMRCAGCGGKVGSDTLSRALDSLDTPRTDRLAIGLAEREDAALLDIGGQRLLALTVDGFRPLFDDPYTSGRIAANHCLGDIYAMGAEPHSALAVVTLAHALEGKLEDDLRQLLRGALEVLREAGADLAGGHTTEGSDAYVGFAVTGLVARDRVLRKNELRPGNALILTKPVGTGTLFAAAMRLEAEGRWIDAAVASMLESNRAAARVLRSHGARACTDVTGFGVLGHLLEMIAPAGVDAMLDLDALPVLPGALGTVERGILSSLHPSNLRLRRAIRDPEELTSDPRYPLLFDPQTAGGLLAGIPADRAEDCLAELRGCGHAGAALIGEVRPRSGSDAPVVVRKRSIRPDETGAGAGLP